MRSYCVGLLAGFLVHTAVASAQDGSMVVIQGGRLFDSRTGVSRPLGQLWIRGDRVLGERAAGTPIPKTARIVEARGCTTLPGLIDAHVHVSGSGSFYDQRVLVAPERNLAAYLASGVTSVLDIYTLEEAKSRLRWSDSALRSAKRRGLCVMACGERRYLSGEEIHRFLKSLQSNET